MANKLPSLLAFLLPLAFQEMMIMRGEAAMCEANSKLFNGACFSSKNCGSICEKEGFMGGECKFWKCVCSKDCGRGSGTPTQGPPLDMPIEGPPSEVLPGEGPPSQGQPEEGPPTEEQPGQGPPSEEQPGEGPPGEEMPPARQS